MTGHTAADQNMSFWHQHDVMHMHIATSTCLHKKQAVHLTYNKHAYNNSVRPTCLQLAQCTWTPVAPSLHRLLHQLLHCINAQLLCCWQIHAQHINAVVISLLHCYLHSGCTAGLSCSAAGSASKMHMLLVYRCCTAACNSCCIAAALIR